MNNRPFVDDAPKQEPEEDRLGYRAFAERLASALAGMKAQKGYVVGLQAPWGAGKSTALNFVKAYLHQAAIEDLIIVDFSPWLISGHQDLISGFFKVLAERVNYAKAHQEETGRKTKRMAASLVDPTFKAIGEVAAALKPEWGDFIKPAASATGSTLNKALIAWAKDPSLQTAYGDLRVALRDGNRRFVVFIDDLDRLEPEEIKAIAQMVKSVGDLPKITYVLAYDRTIVRKALDGTVTESTGPRYDEKIVQHEVSLPTPSRIALRRLLDEHIGSLIPAGADTQRARDLARNGTDRWMRSVRDVVRLSNSVNFAAPALEGELDPLDLVAMEGLRLFDDAAFKWISDNRDFLLNERHALYLRKEEVAESVSRLHQAIPIDARVQVIGLLCSLFPTRSKELAIAERPTYTGDESYHVVAARRGIATPDGFSAYFSLSGTVASVSKVDVDEVMAHLEDEGLVSAAFKKYMARRDETGAPLISAFLEELRYRFDGGAVTSQALVNQVLILGGAIVASGDETDIFESYPLRYINDLLRVMLRSVGVEVAGAMLVAAMSGAVDPFMAASVYVDRARELGAMSSQASPDQPLINAENLELMGPLVGAIITQGAAEGTLATAPGYWDIMRAWKHTGDPDAASIWLKTIAEEEAGNFAKIALGLLSYSGGGQGRSFTLMQRPDDPDFSIEELHRLALKHERDPSLQDDSRKRITALRIGTQQVLEANAKALAASDSSEAT